MTALADAKMDSVPIVAITGQVPTPVVGNDAFQEADITGITMPITKHNFLVKDANELAETIREAFHIASTGRPGPVLVDIPKDVLLQEITWNWPESVDLPGYKPTTKGNLRQVRTAAKMIMESKRPVLYVGGGVIKANASAGAVQARDRGPAAGHDHAHGARRLPRHARARARACPACTATTRPSPRCRRPTCWSRSARGSTTASPASSPRSRRARR